MRSFIQQRSGEGMETYLTIDELAAALKLAVQTIRRYVLKREIPYHKIKKVIRFKPSEVERWIESGGLKSPAGGDSEVEGDLFAGIDDPPVGENEGGDDRQAGETEEVTA
jgi:excisionase family DNA binding protein